MPRFTSPIQSTAPDSTSTSIRWKGEQLVRVAVLLDLPADGLELSSAVEKFHTMWIEAKISFLCSPPTEACGTYLKRNDLNNF